MNCYSFLIVTAAFSVCVFSGCLQPSNVGKTDVPIIQGVKFVGKTTDGARMGDTLNSLKDYTITTWRFGLKSRSMEEVLAFYREKFPDAEYLSTDAHEFDDIPEDELEDEGVIWHSLSQPIGSTRLDDTLDISIGEDFFTITESIAD